MRSILPLLLIAALGSSGCVLQNLRAEERLRDAVVGFNDECRWGRIDLAAQRVVPTFRERFRLTHYNWGRDLQIADSEIIHVQTSGEDQEGAISTVVIRWYDHRTLMLSDTTLRQQWKKVRGNYILLDEVVANGDPRLMEIPEAAAPGTNGGSDDADSVGDARAAL